MSLRKLFKRKESNKLATQIGNNHPTEAEPGRIFISYKRNIKPDEQLANKIFHALLEHGFTPFIDKTMPVGVDWGKEIDRQIRNSEYLLVLLSSASVDSDMVIEEILLADELRKRKNKPIILPVKVNYSDPLPYRLAHCLRHIQHVEWASNHDTEKMLAVLINSIKGKPLDIAEEKTQKAQVEDYQKIDAANDNSRPSPNFDPRILEVPTGVVKVKSKFYIERDCDVALERQILVGGSTTTIRAGRQMGKTSLLVRGVRLAKRNGNRVVYIDFQELSTKVLDSLESLLEFMADKIINDLHLDSNQKEKIWESSRGPSDKFNTFMEDSVLAEEPPLLIAIDEADRLLDRDYKTEFFGLLRAWDARRAYDDLWENLSFILVISTHPHLLIEDHRQSPFNVGLMLYLHDFTNEQLTDLNRRYGEPLHEDELPEMMALLGGHPFLIRQALYTIVSKEMISWHEFQKIALNEPGPFSSHLHFYLWQLRDRPELIKGLKQVMEDHSCEDEQILNRLSAAGLVKELPNKQVDMRCGLYLDYLRRTLYD